MIRGPRFGLGTCRYCCCRWIFLLVALAALLPLFVHMQSGDGVGVGAGRESGAGARVVRRSRNARDDPVRRAGPPPTSSSSSVARSRKYKTAPHDHAPGSNVVEEGAILRLLSKNNLYIQSFPNGTVSATGHESSYYSVLTQIAVGFGQIYIRGVASRLYLCINECGRLYGSETLEENCRLRDQMEGNWYNTYTSIKYSTADKSLFVAFSGAGSPCRLRLARETGTDGRSVVALGSHEKYALFFPVRNVSLPDGMNLTSLMQLNKRLSFARNTGQATGCAPRCSKALDHHQHHQHHAGQQQHNQQKQQHAAKEVKGRNKKANKRKCRCTGSNSGNGSSSKCRRARHCQQMEAAAAVNGAARNNGTRPAGGKRAKPVASASAPTSSTEAPKKKKNAKASNQLDFSLRFTHRNGEGRLIRHIYKKIRARPELADQLIALL